MLNFLKSNKTLILIALCFAPFYLTHGCPIRFFTGISCPSCGMSRAVESLLTADFTGAVHFHPLVFLLPVAFLVYVFRKRIPARTVKALCIVGLCLLAVVYVIRLAEGSDIVYCNVREGIAYKVFHYILS